MANVGDIAVIATLDTSRYKRGASEIGAANKEITGSTGKGGNALEKLSGKLGSLAKTGVKVAAVGLAGLATTVAGLAVGGGISRALNIEDAQAKLKGLGHDAESITNIMDSALASVKGTAYGLDSAATIAASAVAAGIKPGQELTKYLSLTADAATIAGVSLDEMGSIFNKVQTGQKAYTQELNQLADRGIPIYQWLQKELGVTQEELRDMVAEGKVDSQTYFDAIQKNIGGAALESGKTTRGAFKNLLAALSRVGEGIVGGPIDNIRQGFNDMTVFIDENGEKIAGIANGIIQSAIGIATGFVEAGKSVADYLGPKLEALWNTVSTKLIPALSTFWHQFLEPMIPVIGVSLVVALGLALDTLNLLVTSTSWLIDAFNEGNPIVYGLAGAFAFLAGAKGIGMAMAALTTFRTVSIPKAVASMGVLKGAVTSPIVMPAIAVGLAIAALATVIKKHQETRAEIERTNEKIRGNDRLGEQIDENMKQRLADGKITQEQYQEYLRTTTRIADQEAARLEETYSGAIGSVRHWLDSLMGSESARKYEEMKSGAGIGGRYTGGPVSANRPYVVGENPDGSLNRTSELFVPRSAGRIINAKDLQSALSGRGGGVTNNIQNVNIASEVDGERWLRRLNGNQEIVSNGLVPTQSYM